MSKYIVFLATVFLSLFSPSEGNATCIQQGGTDICVPAKPAYPLDFIYYYIPNPPVFISSGDAASWWVAQANAYNAQQTPNCSIKINYVEASWPSPPALADGTQDFNAIYWGYERRNIRWDQVFTTYDKPPPDCPPPPSPDQVPSFLEMVRDRTIVDPECPQGFGLIGGYDGTRQAADGHLCFPNVPPQDPGRCDVLQGNPINAANGQKVEFAIDLSLPKFSWGRIYRSTGWPYMSILGAMWTASYTDAIQTFATNPTAVVLWRADGSAKSFTFDGTAWNVIGNPSDFLSELLDSSGHRTGWLLRNIENNQFYAFDATGRLLKVTQVNGQSVSLGYAETIIKMVSDFQGRGVSFIYDSLGRIGVATDSAGGSVTYEYDAITAFVSGASPLKTLNLLTSVTVADGRSRAYWYNEPGHSPLNALSRNLTGITDENGGRFASYYYDNDGHAYRSEHAGGAQRVSISGGAVTDAIGTTRQLYFSKFFGVSRLSQINEPGGSGCHAAFELSSFDANGNVILQQDFNMNSVRHAYAGDRSVEVQRTEAVGSSSPRIINTQWHPLWQLEAARSEPNKMTTWIYNGQPDLLNGGAPASCAANAPALPDGSPIAVLCKKVEQATSDANGSQGFGATAVGTPRIWHWTYDGDGQVLTAKGPRTDVNDTTTFVYRTADDTGSPMKYRRGDLYSVTDPLGHVTTMPEYDLDGRLSKMIDPNGLVTTMAYSPRGWLIDRVATSASGVIETTHYDYDGVGQMTKATQPDGSYVTYVYDAAHRLTDVADGLGNGIHYTLDAMGNRTQEQVKDPSGVLTQNITRNYDALNRLQTVTGALQ